MKLTIKFVDKGQDFLEWDVAPHPDDFYREMGSGIVTECRPFQSSVWVNKNVYEYKSLKKGSVVKIGKMIPEKMCDQLSAIKYKVSKITGTQS